MPVSYGGMHSAMFIRLSDGIAKHSWNDLHLIPESRPVIASPEPKVQLIEIPGRSKRIDLSDYMPGGLIYGPRSGDLIFYVDHDKWNGWENAYNELESLFNGDKFAMYLMDNITNLYEGRIYLTEYSSDDSYSTVTLHYEMEPEIVTDGYVNVTFKESSEYDDSVIQTSIIRKNTIPKCYKDLPQHYGYVFDYWTPSISAISTDTVYTAVYREAYTYTIQFVDWNGVILKSSIVVEGDKPIPPSDPVRIGYEFANWGSEIEYASSDKTYTAKYFKDETYINNPWEEVKNRVADGSYKTYYHVGDKVFLDIDGEYNDYVEIVAIDKDVKSYDSDDSRVIPLSFITKNTLVTKKKYMDSAPDHLIGYNDSDIRSYINNLSSKLPTTLQGILSSVFKYVENNDSRAEVHLTSVNDKIWLPSIREIIGDKFSNYHGITYDDIFIDVDSRTKLDKNGEAAEWYLRDTGIVRDTHKFAYRFISPEYDTGYGIAWDYFANISIGFCVCDPTSFKYLVKFYDYDETEPIKKYWADYNSAPLPPSDPTREGYIFNGWGKDLVVITDDQTYVAKYKKICTIVFNDYDGTQLLTYTIIEGNKLSKLPLNPTREGYEFTGWDKNVDEIIYDDITYTAEYRKLYTITYVDYDGTYFIAYNVLDGDMPPIPDNPTREGYAFDYWNPSVTNATEDATYTAVYRKLYRITFNDYDGTLLEQYWAEYNSYPIISDTPTRPGYTFVNWNPNLVNVVEDAAYTAVYLRNPITLADTWDDVDARIKDGTYSSYYVVGDKIALKIGSYYNDYAQIAGIDVDKDSNGNTVPLTFITANCLNSEHVMNSTATKSDAYPGSALKTYVDGRKSSFPAKVRNMIVPVVKTSRKWDESTNTASDLTTTMELWVPSSRETGHLTSGSCESSGPIYSGLFNSNESRQKLIKNASSPWWVRSMTYRPTTFVNNDFWYANVTMSGAHAYLRQTGSLGVVIGFCVGASS